LKSRLCYRVPILPVIMSTISCLVLLGSCSRKPESFSSSPSLAKIPVKTVLVRPGTLQSFRSIPGRVTFDPHYYRRVMARVSAISTVRLRAFPGDHVRKGEVVAVLKSPDFLTAESELVSILNNRGGRLTPHDSLLALAKSKLVYMGASDQEIHRLLETRKPVDRYEVRSPIDGTIVKTGEMEGSQVHPGDVLFEVSDLRHLWVKAFIYPGEEGHITKKSPVWIQTLHDPDRMVPARIKEVSPMVDPMTRTIPIRIALSNQDLLLEPDLWVSVLIPRPSFGTKTSFIVPSGSIFESRTGHLTVIVRDITGQFRRVRVVLGATDRGQTAVFGKFRSGDQAVTVGLDRVRALVKKGPSPPA